MESVKNGACWIARTAVGIYFFKEGVAR